MVWEKKFNSHALLITSNLLLNTLNDYTNKKKITSFVSDIDHLKFPDKYFVFDFEIKYGTSHK